MRQFGEGQWVKQRKRHTDDKYGVIKFQSGPMGFQLGHYFWG